MYLDLHPDIRIRQLTIGAERAPLLVIDNFIADAARLVKRATTRQFVAGGSSFPGIRAEAPSSYQELIASRLQPLLFDYFDLRGSSFEFPTCHYSLVTMPAVQLGVVQRIPHFDSIEGNALASVHYLFDRDLGGTAFYRHRKTGFEYIDASRREPYIAAMEAEDGGPDLPPPEYINGDTALFEQVSRQEAMFNRILFYRRNSLHSACIRRDFVPDADPRSGRLSINAFIDVRP